MAATKRDFILSSGIGLSADNIYTISSTNSTSIGSGAIIVAGGVGIGSSVSIGGRLQMFNGANYTAFVSSASGNTVYTLPATSPATGSSVLQSTSAGVLSWVPMVAGSSSSGNTSQNVVINAAGNANVFHPVLFTPLQSSSGSAVSSDSTITFNPSSEILNVSGLAVTSQTSSTNTSSGALIVSGGVGVGGTIFAGGLNIQDIFTLGSQIFYPQNTRGFSVNENYNPVGSGASHTGYHFASGVGRSSIYFDLAISNQYTVMFGTYGSSTGNTFVIGSETANSDFEFRSTVGIQPVRLDLGTLLMRINRNGNVLIPASTNSTTTSTGALTVTGGVGIGQSVSVGGRLQLFNGANYTAFVSSASGNTVYTLPATSPATGSSVLQSDTTGVMSWVPMIASSSVAGSGTVAIPGAQYQIAGYYSGTGASVSGSTTFTNHTANAVVNISHTTNSNNPSSGALTVTGGVGIGQSVSVLGRLQLFNSSIYTAFVSSATGNTVYTLPATSPATGSSVLQSTAAGVMSWVPMVAGSSSSGNTSQNVVINAAGNANVFHPVLFTPLQNSSGSAVSSDSTISFNPSTEILNVSGLAITSGTASTNTTTGALVVRGGLGVTGQLSFATASFGFTGITTNPTMSFIGATSSSPITLTVLTDNSLNWEGSQGSVFSIDSNLSSGEIFSVSDISGLPIISASAGQTVTFNEFGGYTQFGNGSINSSSTTTGALVVSGGVGITGNANIGGTVRLTNTTNATSVSSGALVVSGGLGVDGDVYINNRANSRLNIMHSTGDEGGEIFLNKSVTNTTLNTGLTIDIFQNRLRFFEAGGSNRGFYLDISSGGNSVGTNIMGGASSGTVNSGTATFAAFYGGTSNAVSENANLQFTGTGLSVGGNINSTSTKSGALYVNGGLGVTGNAFIGGTTTIQSSVASISSSTGALVVSGGAGIAQSISVGGRLQLFNSSNYTAFVSSATGNTVYTLPATSPAVGTSYLTSNSSGVMSWTAPNKANYVLSFGAGFTPTADSADSVSLNVPYLPDGTLKYYYIKRIEYRNETLSGGTGLSFYLQRHTTGNASWNTTNTITAGSGASFYVGSSVYSSSFTTIASSAGVAGSIVSGDYLRLFFTGVNSAANLSIAMTIEEQ